MEWYRAHPEQAKARSAKWMRDNWESSQREYHATKWAEIRNDPERYQAYLQKRLTGGHKKAWREANKGQAAERQRRHQQEHREQWAAYAAKRRALKAGNGGDFTGDEWIAMKQAYDYTCLRCGRRQPEIDLTMDHVVPISCGGRHEAANIQPLCSACNSAKHDAEIDYRRD
jgi:5-methylcytosine-specific restriction endonuclease McrA